jgi:hypothetical protein
MQYDMKSENGELKKKLAELEAKQKEEESEEEEYPMERIVYSSGDELSYEEWEAKELRRLKEAEHCDPLPPTCLKRLKRGYMTTTVIFVSSTFAHLYCPTLLV